MAQYDIWELNGTLQAEKVKSPKQSNVVGFSYVGTVNATAKGAALKQAKVKINSGLFKVSVASERSESKFLQRDKSKEQKTVIYCDYNGVLDDRDRDNIYCSSNKAVEMAKKACPHKMFMLAKLAIKHNAYIVLTSMLRRYGGDIFTAIYKSLKMSEIQEYIDFIKENKMTLRKLCFIDSTPHLNEDRDLEIKTHIAENNVNKFVVFEDSEFISEELNPIMTQWSVGLLQEHIEQADAILS